MEIFRQHLDDLKLIRAPSSLCSTSSMSDSISSCLSSRSMIGIALSSHRIHLSSDSRTLLLIRLEAFMDSPANDKTETTNFVSPRGRRLSHLGSLGTSLMPSALCRILCYLIVIVLIGSASTFGPLTVFACAGPIFVELSFYAQQHDPDHAS